MQLSLRSRLILMTFLVAAVAVTTVGLLARQMTLIEFNRFLTQKEDAEPRPNLSTARLIEQYGLRGDWRGAQEIIESMGAATGRQLILTDSRRDVVAAYPRELLRSRIEISPDADIKWEATVLKGDRQYTSRHELRMVPHDVLAEAGGKPIGALYYMPLPSQGLDSAEEVFVDGLNRTLLIAGLASAGVALMIALVLAKRMLRPIEELTGAAKRMGMGELGQRVAVSSSDEIGELARAFNSMAESLSRTEQLRRNMVSDVAHELRTPLTNIRCHIETLQDGLKEPTPEFINSLHDEAMVLNRLVEDLQDLALAEAGQLRIELRRVQVRAEVEGAVTALRHQIDEAGLTIGINVPEALEAHADPNRLAQVLRNLLANAITHTSAGGSIRVQANGRQEEVWVRVEDTGCGITREAMPFVFERFYRPDASREHATGGVGLGLAIVKQIVVAHGGRVWVESEVNKGTTVFFTLPNYTVPYPDS